METLNKLQISSEIAEEVKNNSEFIWFFAGKAYEEKLYIIPNYKAINSKELVNKLKDFVETLPQFILQSLLIKNIIIFTNISFDTFCINNFVIEKYSENNISLNIEIEEDFHFLSVNKNDLVAC